MLRAKQEKELMEKYPKLTGALYKASHHGSDNSNSQSFLEQLSPRITVVSCSENNSYGHPADEVLQRLKAAGCAVYRTDLHGTITYRG